MSLLVIGYGNALRGDDGVGPAVARQVAAWGLPGVSAAWAHGLTPELAEPISRADATFFVDARAGGESVEVCELAPSAPPRLGHASHPGWLLALAEALWGRRPRAWLVTVPADRFGFGEPLSEAAQRGMAAALREISRLVELMNRQRGAKS
jgi:hydrogenase maturation protease